MLELIRTYYVFNSWATDQILHACEQLSPEEYNASGCSGHGSVGQTLAHAIMVQRGWFAWFDKSTEMKEAIALMRTDDVKTLANAREQWEFVQKESNKFLDRLTDEELKGARTFTRMNGKTESKPLWKLMMHTANHGTHTRAQVVAAIRRFGHNPGNVDLLNYVLSVE
ncbi:MAG TPA: DinB family protein [Candidatus Kapabacteria bacterium]|jgi:uncharacterized damage-inducible protein DinB|nr:DinB family protein [Candidatus Kapabacteria bacterium]